MRFVKLGEITENLDKKRVPLNAFQRNAKTKKKLYPYVGANNILCYIDDYIFDEEILCVAEDGGGWGPKQICAIIYNEKCWVNNHAHVLRAKEGINLTYIKNYLNYADLNSYITGATRGKLTRKYLDLIKIPLPSTDDQTRIATLLSKVESLIAKRKKSIADLDELLKSIFLEMFGDPVRNERGWKIEKLGNLALIERGRFSPRPRNDPKYYNGEYPFIQTGDISRAAGRLNKYTQTLNELGTKVSKEFKAGTIVIAIVGATIGETAVLEINSYAPDSVIGISPIIKGFESKYLEFLLRFWKPVLKSQAPEAARANINIQSLKPLKVITPPIKKIQKFEAFITKTESIKKSYFGSLTGLETLYSVFSQKAFKGVLDLSRVPLVHELKPKNITTGAPQLGKPSLTVQKDPQKEPVSREQTLHHLFQLYVSDLKNDCFSLDNFWIKAEEKFMETMDEEDPPLGMKEYDQVKKWLFELLASGKALQVFNEDKNRMEIRMAS